MKKLLLYFIFCVPILGLAQCPVPTQLSASQITGNSATFSWTNVGIETEWQVIVLPLGSPAPTNNTSGIISSSTNPYVFTGLSCNTDYTFFVRSVCGPEDMSEWVGVNFWTINCQGTDLPPMQQCDNGSDGIEMFDLTMYEMEYQFLLPPGDYTFTYHMTTADAEAEINPLPEMFPATLGVQLIIVRAENVMTGEYELFELVLILNELPQVGALPPAQECDDNGDGIESFSLYQTSQYIYSTYAQNPNTWSVTYYGTEADAQAQANPIWNIESYTNTTNPQYLYVAIVNNQIGCMTIKPLLLQAVECTGIAMTAFLDLDNDGIRDSGEPLFPSGEFNYQLNEGDTHYVQSIGEYAIYDADTANMYDIGYTVAPEYASLYTVAPASYENIAITGSGMQQFYFAVSAAQTVNDLFVALIPSQAPRPGFTYTNTIVYSNHGNTTASGVITFSNDPLVTITNVSQTGIVSGASGFSYAFTGLLPFESRTIVVTMQVPVIPTVQIGDQLVNSVSIESSATDAFPQDNSASLSQTIVGSYDPNDKAEAHGGKIVFSEFGTDDYLQYTIRFENTGTAEAINIRIEDELHSSLDPTTVRMVSASHFYAMERDGSQLTWTFENVMLPPTIQDPIGSHGYVTFMVKPDAGFALGDIIPNTASIFFDFNPAIVTNTFETQFVTSLSVGDINTGKFVVYPNPASELLFISSHDGQNIVKATITDMMGKIIQSHEPMQSNEAFQLDVSGISSGIYLLEVAGSETRHVTKLVIN